MRASLLFFVLISAAPAQARPPLEGKARWACFYGRILSEAAWKNMDLAILEAGAFQFPKSSGPIPIGYVSAGEANESRDFWPAIKDKPWVVEANPEWPGAHRVDFRSGEWKSLLLDSVIPGVLERGYKGVMLDTLDVAGYLESSAPARFAGNVRAAEDLILSIREKFPDILILTNNGLPLLDKVAGAVDGAVVEDLYTRCPAAQGPCTESPREQMLEKERLLRGFKDSQGKPVFVFIYARLGQHRSRLVREAVRRCLKNGFHPFIATPALDRLGVVAPRG